MSARYGGTIGIIATTLWAAACGGPGSETAESSSGRGGSSATDSGGSTGGAGNAGGAGGIVIASGSGGASIGSSSASGAGGEAPCVPLTCKGEGYTCGELDDGCGKTIDCGSCAAPETCGGGPKAHACGCTPTTCEAAAASCGQVEDGCGGFVACGACAPAQTCGGRGTPNVCGAMPVFCSKDGWCWELPSPHGQTITDAAFLTDTEGWGVGSFGLIQRWDGAVWSPSPSGTSEHLLTVHARASDDAWAAGLKGVILHWDGTAWSSTISAISSTLRGIFTESATNAWAVGDDGVILKWNGLTWDAEVSGTTADLYDVWVGAGGDAWVVGSYGTVLHRVAGVWTSIDTGSSETFWEVWGAGPDDIWIAGSDDPCFFCNDYGDVWHGGSAGFASVLHKDDQLFSIAGTSSNDVWVGGESSYRWDGTSWSFVPNAGSLIRMSSPANVWAFQSYGRQLQWTGAMFTPYNSPLVSPLAIHGVDADHVWATTSDAILKWTGGGWASISAPFSMASANGIWASDPANIWVLSSFFDGIYRFGDAGFDKELATQGDLMGIHGASATDIWAVGQSAYHYDGMAWTELPTSSQSYLYDVWTFGPTAIAVGVSGAIERFDGTMWSAMPSGTTETLYAVWASSEMDAWAVGAKGTILHLTGGAWSVVPSPTTEHLRGIWGVGPKEVYAVGDTGTLIAYDGIQWSHQATNAPRGLSALWASPTARAWAGGESGLLSKPTGDGMGGGCSPACASGSWCNGGICVSCDNDAHCGPLCVTCDAGAPYCSEGSCVECRTDSDCPDLCCAFDFCAPNIFCL